MTSPTGRSDFADEIKDAGGVKNLAKTNYARNMWYIIKTFKALPTLHGNFYDLTDWEYQYIMAELNLDLEEEEAARNGQVVDYDNSFSDNDDEWFEHPETIKEQTPEEIQSTREQLAALMDKDTEANLNNNFAKMDRMLKNEQQNSSLAKAEEAVDQKYQGLLDLMDNGSQEDIKAYRDSLNGRGTGATPSKKDIDNRLSGKGE